MSPIWLVAVSAVVYASAAFLGIQFSAAICRDFTPFEDGPRPGRPPVALFIACSGLLGGWLAWRGATIPALLVIGIVCVALVASSYSDVRCGIVPDYFTLVPLIIIFVIALVTRQWPIIFSSLIVAAPFAVAALLSKGLGMGWGDVKLVALGGAVLGLTAAIVALVGACVVAVAVTVIRKRRGEPIAFAPYLAGAIGAALTFNVFP
jgi:prepilin signal peptidase PulO-like enzyme (type II secretory pathway)